MPERIMFQQVTECENIELLFQEFCPLGAYTFEVFNRTG
jgi:hypothetical protein